MPKILCVDDELELREGLVEILQEEGYETEEAVNGRNALDVLKNEKFNLVLCDINMPEMSGYELLREVRENHDELAKTPFVFLTALADDTHIELGLELGVEAYITKPIDFELLIEQISVWLDTSDLDDAAA